MHVYAQIVFVYCRCGAAKSAKNAPVGKEKDHSMISAKSMGVMVSHHFKAEVTGTTFTSLPTFLRSRGNNKDVASSFKWVRFERRTKIESPKPDSNGHMGQLDCDKSVFHTMPSNHVQVCVHVVEHPFVMNLKM